MPKVLIVTNDFPPRAGGIQSFVHAVTERLPDVVVYAPRWAGAAEFDAAQPFEVVRHPTSLMLPTPAVARRAATLLRERGCDAVWFGAAAPLGLLAPALRKGQEIAIGDTITHVKEGIACGALRDIDPEYIAQAILGVTGQLARTFIHERGTDPDEVAAAAIAVVLDGILVDSRTPAR